MMTDTATDVTSDPVDLSDFDDMWADAAAAEVGSTDDGTTESLEVTPEVITGLEDTDAVEGEVIPPVADKPEGASDEWDWSVHADKTVPVKIGDVEESVTLKELRDGYLRQQDYTRKTQQVAQVRDLAKWAQDVQQGFEVDPAGMIEAFKRAFRVDEAAKPDPLENIDEDLRPVYEQNLQLQQQIVQLQEAYERQEKERVLEGVKRDLEALKGEYGESFDPRETIMVAQQYNLPLREAHLLRMARTGALSAPAAPASPPVTPQVVAGAEVVDAAVQAAEAARLAGKQAAQGSTSGRRFKASEVATDQFDDIGELFEIIQNGSSS